MSEPQMKEQEPDIVPEEEQIIQQETDEKILDTDAPEGQPTKKSAEEQSDTPEDRARRMGWKPKEEYGGQDGGWVDADTFLQRTEEEIPQLRKSLKTIERNYAKLERNTADILAHQERQIEAERQRAYNQAYADLQARYIGAVEQNDADAARQAWTAREELMKRQQADQKPAPQAQNSTYEAGVVAKWQASNPWYEDDPVLADYAAKYEDNLAKRGVGLEERLEKTTAYIKRKFPQDFGSRIARQAPRMNGGGNNVAKKPPEPGTYEALTAEAKAECDRTIKTSGGKITKQDWLKYATPDMFIGAKQ